jgi:hypothetical protein
MPTGGATKLLFTSACEGAASRALGERKTAIWTSVEQQVLAPQAPVALLTAIEPVAPLVRVRRQPLGSRGEGWLPPLWASAMDCRSLN